MPQQTIDRLLGLLHDPIFWIATVAFGLLITITGNYITRAADMLWARYRGQKKERNVALEASVLAAARHILEHPDERFDLKLDILFYSQRSILYSAWTVTFLALAVLAKVLSEDTIAKVFTLTSLIMGLISWLLVGLYFLRERRARRVLIAFSRVSKSKTYNEVLDEFIANKNKRSIEERSSDSD
jgi:hypothetical protein